MLAAGPVELTSVYIWQLYLDVYFVREVLKANPGLSQPLDDMPQVPVLLRVDVHVLEAVPAVPGVGIQ